MPDLQTPEAAAEEIRAVATDVGALVVPSLPGGRGLPKSVVVELVDLIALVRHLRPKLVYLDEVRFEAARHIAELVNDEDEGLVEHVAVQNAAKRLKRHEGSMCQVVAIVVHDGIDHAVVHEAAWMDDVRAAVERISDDLEEQRRIEAERQNFHLEVLEKERLEQEEQGRRGLIREKAAMLSVDPRFGVGRTSKAKRKHLAKTLFPDLSNAMLTKIVDEAEGAAWLRSTQP